MRIAAEPEVHPKFGEAVVACVLNGGFQTSKTKESTMGLLLLIVIVLLLVGAFPAWPHARSWGYGPSGLLGALLIVILVLMLLNVIAPPWGPVVVVR
jgi:hypothetical protein